MGLAGRRVGATVAVAALAVALLAACGGSGSGSGDGLSSGSGESSAGQSGGSGQSGHAEAGTVPDDVVAVDADPAEITALDNTFDERAIRVRAGTTVRWTNHGHQDHDIVPAEGDDWGVDAGDFGPGTTYEHRFDRPGTYNYYCTIHGTAARGMVGVVVVD
jgi:plastocyanin